MRSRTDVAGLSCAVVSGRGGGLTCAAAVVVLYRQPRRACRAAGVRGRAPRGGGWARRPKRHERARTQATGDRRPRPITVYAGQLRGRRAPPPDDKQGRRASQTSHNLGFAVLGGRNRPPGNEKLRLDATSPNPNYAGCKFRRPPTSGRPSEVTEGRRGLPMRAGVLSGTQGDGPGRWPPKTRQPGGRTRVCQSGWRPAARLTGRAASKYRTCQAQAGGGGTTPGGQTARDRPRPPREMYAESGQRVGGWAPWGRACAPKPGGGTTTLPQG